MHQSLQKEETDKELQTDTEYLESHWHQFARLFSNDGFCKTQHNLGQQVSSFRTGGFFLFKITFPAPR